MLDSLIALLLQLPLGVLLAAGLLELFVLFKGRRDAEPAVLWLLFCATVLGLLCGGGYYLMRGTLDYSLWVGLAAGLAAIGFWFKRAGRNRGVTSLKDRFMVAGSYSPVMMPGQTLYVLGYRASLIGAMVLTVLGLHNGKVLQPSGLADTNTTVAENTTEQPAAPAPDGSVAAAPTPAPEGSAPAPAVDPTAAAPTVAATTTPPTPGEAIPAPAPGDATVTPAPAAPGDATATTTAPPAATPAMTPGTPAAPGAANPAAPAVPVVATTQQPTPPAAAVADMRPVSKNSTFGAKIRPIIQRYCVTCHGAEKQKGDLRLDTPDFIRAGVRGKAVILAGKPDASAFFTSITKPPGDDDRMPPKGDGVSPSDAALIKKWIMDGADMGDGVSTASSGDAKFAIDDLGAKLQPPPAALIDELKQQGVLIQPISRDGRVVGLDFSHADIAAGEYKLERLAPIAQNIHTLDLSRTRITDDDLSHLSGMIHLARLILSRTDTTDVGLSHLKNLNELEHINIYQTKVTDAGLKNLENLRKLKKLYAWQSMVTQNGATSLQSKLPGLAVNMGQ